MNMTVILITLVLLAASSYYVGLKKSISIQKSDKLHSAPIYHGSLLAIYSLIVSLLFILIWHLFENYLYPEFSVSRKSVCPLQLEVITGSPAIVASSNGLPNPSP